MTTDLGNNIIEPDNGIAKEEQEGDVMLDNLAKDYSKYLTVDIAKENHAFEESIEELLTKLDEYCSLVDIIRSDSTLCLDKTLPAIHAKSMQMSSVFKRIDNLETFVGVVKQQVNMVEQHICRAEEELGLSAIKKIISSISLPRFLRKKSDTPPTAPKSLKFTPIEVYKTEDYIESARSSKESSKEAEKHKPKSPSAVSETNNSAPEDVK